MNRLLPTLLFLFICILSSASCHQGESQEVIQARIDREVALRLEQAKEIEKRRQDHNLVKSVLNEFQTELVVLEQKLEDVKRPRFLRTRSEKDAQLRDAAKSLQHYEDYIVYLSKLLTSIDNGLPYELNGYLNERKEIAAQLR